MNGGERGLAVTGREARIVQGILAVLALTSTVFVLQAAWTGTVTALVLRSAFFSLLAAAGLLEAALRMRSIAARAGCYLLAAIALVPGLHLWDIHFELVLRGGLSTPLDRIVFVGLLVVLFALVRLTLGWTMVCLVATALLYACFGDLVPGRYGHGGYDLARLTSTLMLSTEGIFGIPMGVAVEYIFPFTLLGAVLVRIGTGEAFVALARAVTGRMPGGPGLAAALASTLVGTVNGSAVANVVTTGTFTIPLMKRTGYSALLAGAIEAAASSAGQILPPVMGAAAFLMAEIVGVPYREVASAALLPGLLYVYALLLAIRLEAGKRGLAPDPEAGAELARSALGGRKHLLLPPVALVVFLAVGHTPAKAAVYAIVVALLLSLLRAGTRLHLRDVVRVCRETVATVVPITAAVAAAGAVIGVLNLTGLGLVLSSLVVDLGGGHLWAVLLLTALASFVLGTGLPTSAAYLLLAVTVAPALVRMGVPALVAHMFIFYYGLLSAITPPVALAAYAAAGISGADANRTALEALRLGFVKVLVPFLFVSMPGLLLIGPAVEIGTSVVLALLGTTALAVAFAGWCGRELGGGVRVVVASGALLLLWPDAATSVRPVTVLARTVGLLVLIAVTVWLARTRSAPAGRVAAATTNHGSGS